ncbi:hypothetical protein [Nesterenkonia natronophila]|uniref:Uncharacterized protein n=1 Tax=Nesterenkonia natronophila TaxID=2174932 RepID=A0A3A4F2V5_9MICC|nr:hypothetical protein [Nesterenkonia natronophila]RJN32061.1 hypothetical protein D3250_08230 [Nesterenkonia natronophila]
MTFSVVGTPVRSLLIALGSLFLAYGYFAKGRWLAVAVIIALLLVGTGFVLDWVGRRRLKASSPNPKAAYTLMQGWVLVPSGLAAVASALVIVVAVQLAAPDGVTSETKELIGALSAGVTAFLTTMWIDPSEDVDSAIADRVQKVTYETFVSRAGAADSRLSQVINAGEFVDELRNSKDNVGYLADWSRKNRIQRAEVIKQELHDA